jgi:hypothetical protein
LNEKPWPNDLSRNNSIGGESAKDVLTTITLSIDEAKSLFGIIENLLCKSLTIPNHAKKRRDDCCFYRTGKTQFATTTLCIFLFF